MNQRFQERQVASLSRIVAGIEVLVARVTVDDEVLTVRAEEVGRALVTLHGMPVPGMKIAAKVEYMTMPAAEFASLPDYR